MLYRILPLFIAWGSAAAIYAAPPPGHANESLFQLIRDNDLAGLKQQLRNGADPNQKGERATTPLMHAAAFGRLEAMHALIDAKADVNAKNAFDATALMWCASDLAKVRLLLEKGADVNAKSKQGRTPLLIAASHNGAEPIVRLLLAKGADPKAIDGFQNTAMIAASQANDIAVVKLMAGQGVDINAKNRAGDTALMNAASFGNLEAVRLLLKAGADVNAVSGSEGFKAKNGPLALGQFTALLLATTYGSPEIVKTLLDAGADINAKDIRGMTPLMLSVSSEYQNPAVVQLLLARGADPTIKSLAGETARDWAEKFRQPAVISLLKESGVKTAKAKE
ncbi:MAG TPA: ankyrin repeat domain-containing protein [Bryobacteraceae bacterium]|nr:ankyrin repeat domain-containing protein [Bryobacteraceae bacterium]